jgi:radical SAM/Cys-rich protein
MNVFEQVLSEKKLLLRRGRPEILQLNVGKLCNLTCIHCHVSAGPRRKEIISKETIDKVLDWFEASDLPILDLTGGAPEMIPDFQYLIQRVRGFSKRRHIIDRCNLTILLEPGYEHMAKFLAENKVEIIASMPCYEAKNVEEQRGSGVFDKSIKALQLLNQLGYGVDDPDLQLNLVYNPNGAFLPPDQAELEADYKREMKKHFNISFNKLYVLTNLPIARFAKWLKKNDEYESYMQLLKDSFNSSTVNGLMCRNTVSVSWKGEVYDCDFNQMMNMPFTDNSGASLKLWQMDERRFEGRAIATADHCFGCTAGSGSSCGGTLLS